MTLASFVLSLALGAPAQGPARPARILFIGNSFTYVNDVPAIVAAFAESAGLPAPVCRAIVSGGFSLEDHWDRGAAQKALAEETWDFAVLQQGPSASPEGRGLLIRYARRFDPLIRRAGGRPALFMVWPSVERRRDFGGVSDSYRLAAEDIGALLLPAGDAWRIAEKRAPGVKLYSADGLHPTPAGSYLAAAVIYGRLFDKSPVGLPSRLVMPSGAILELPASEAAALQSAAAQATGR
jgi:hypothetical protein